MPHCHANPTRFSEFPDKTRSCLTDRCDLPHHFSLLEDSTRSHARSVETSPHFSSLGSSQEAPSTGLERRRVMRTSLAAATALAGSLLLPCLMLGSAQAVTSAPELKNV